MSALHEAVARAIADAAGTPWTRAEQQAAATTLAAAEPLIRAAERRLVLNAASDALNRQVSGTNEELRPFIYCDVALAVLAALREQA